MTSNSPRRMVEPEVPWPPAMPASRWSWRSKARTTRAMRPGGSFDRSAPSAAASPTSASRPQTAHHARELPSPADSRGHRPLRHTIPADRRGRRSPAVDHVPNLHEHPWIHPTPARDQQLQDETASLTATGGRFPARSVNSAESKSSITEPLDRNKIRLHVEPPARVTVPLHRAIR